MSRTSRFLVIVGMMLVAAIGGTTTWLILAQRAADLADTWQSNANLAQALAEQTSRTLQPVDLTLREILGRLTLTGAEPRDDVSGWSSKAIFDLLVERLKGLPQIESLVVVKADGNVANISRAFPPMALDLSGRDYYRYFSANDDHGIFVSVPVKSYLGGKWMVFLARRINDLHGSFAGVVVAAVTLSYLEDFYRAVTPEYGSVTVLRRNGVVVLHYPPDEHMIGLKLPAEAPWYEIAAAGGGFYRSSGYLTKVIQLVTVRPLHDFPLVIDVTRSEVSALSRWQGQMLWLLTGGIVASVCMILLLRIFAIQYNRLARQNALLETGQQQFDAVLENMSQGLVLFDRDQNLLVCNHRFAEMYHLTSDQVQPGSSFLKIISHRLVAGTFLNMSLDEYLARAKTLRQGAKAFELTDELCDGRSVLLRTQPMSNGGWVTTHEDISERRDAEANLAFMARHDALTKLANRTLFQERLAEAITLSRRGGHCALMCLDLDRFKVINDTLGHPVGDGLLQAVSKRLSSLVRKGDTVARLGGDEFAIIQRDLSSPQNAARLAKRIIEALREPYDIDGHRIMVGSSIGISIAPKDGTSSDTLVKNADVALYLAKTKGRGTFRFFEPELDSYIQQRREIELDLGNSLPSKDFELYYQPILDLASERVTGFEALIRWNHPVRGLVSPAEFIPIAEETGLIVAIGEWALQAACMEAATWPPDIEIAVNLSAVQFRGTRLLTVVQEALAVSGLSPHRLELEITESLLMENSADRLVLLHQLRALGIRIALDDFGTGFSSLSYLRSFPFDKIKIDRAFIRDVDSNKDSAVIVGAVVALAKGLGMTTVAEGIETERQLAKVREQGCVKVQGYLFSPPRPSREASKLIGTLRIQGMPEADPVAELTNSF